MTPSRPNAPDDEYDESGERSPVFASWKSWYALVLIAFALVVAIMSWFSVAFLP